MKPNSKIFIDADKTESEIPIKTYLSLYPFFSHTYAIASVEENIMVFIIGNN